MDSYCNRPRVQCGRMFSILFVAILFLYRQDQVKSTTITYLSCNQTVVANDTAECLCIAIAKPTAARITWLRNGSVLNRTQTNITYSDGGKNCYDDNPNNPCVSWSTLELFNTQPADSGSYVCHAKNYYSRFTKQVNITVQVIPVITIPPLNDVSEVLKDITSNCVAIGNPRAVIQWKKNGKLLSNISLGNIPKILITNSTVGDCTITDPPSHCKTISTLKIFSTQYDDNGEYICTASNMAGSTSQSAVFTVIVAPVCITQPLDTSIETLSNMTFCCTVVAKPQAFIEWIKNGNTMTNVSDDCNITKVIITRSTKGSCTITDPLSECETSSLLNIFNTKPDDSGNYICNASNQAGYVEANAYLSVDGFPIIVISPTNKKFVKYHNILFVCAAIGYPRPEIEWLKDDSVLINNTSNIAIHDEQKNCESIKCTVYSYLWILNATMNDVGSYTCNATNFAGYDSSTAQLTLEQTDNNELTLVLGITGGLAGLIALTFILVLIYRYRRKLLLCIRDPERPNPDHGAEHGADRGADHGAERGADHGAERGADHGRADEGDPLLGSGDYKRWCSVQ